MTVTLLVRKNIDEEGTCRSVADDCQQFHIACVIN